ncbi:hypothetical protein [Pelagicoccus sp. SDUM812005]|uniref:hypothetical protein n=1 Tax=Pelagicoccus sp. SDUM812005 TaxID=3041257 RepID=UPI00280E4CCE|nr:hypothetical protein [Pelagicoccus sp. SDUM812005]MDQ8182087.1 hypothetical protein [Pelagicoccus sp. SDUM812005]
MARNRGLAAGLSLLALLALLTLLPLLSLLSLLPLLSLLTLLPLLTLLTLLTLLPLLALLSLLTLLTLLALLSLLTLLPLLTLLTLALTLGGGHGEGALLPSALAAASTAAHDRRHAGASTSCCLGDGSGEATWHVDGISVDAGNVGLDIDGRELRFVDGRNAAAERGIVGLDFSAVGTGSVLYCVVDRGIGIDLRFDRGGYAQAQRDREKF